MTERLFTKRSVSQTDSPSDSLNDNQSVVKTNRVEVKPTRSRGVAEATSLESTLPSSHRRFTAEKGKDSKPAYANEYRKFRTICDHLVDEVGKLSDFLQGDMLLPEGAEVTVEVEALLEQLYDCEWGQGQSLKSVVVAIQAQINNAQWDKRHVQFLTDVIPFLRVRYVIDGETVKQVYDAVRGHGLDEFRGTVSETPVKKKYRLEEVVEP